MKIGFNMFLWTVAVTEEHYPVFETLKAAGYDGVELPLGGGDEAFYARTRKVLDDLGLEATAALLFAGGPENPISPDPAKRSAALDKMKWAIDCSRALNSSVLMGPFYQPLGEFTGAGASASEKEWCADVHRQAADYAGPDMMLAVEPLNRFEAYFLNTFAQAKEHVLKVDRPNFKAAFDTFHANIEEKNYATGIKSYADVLGYVQLSENDRGAPGTGHVDFAALIKSLSEIGYDGWLTLESFGQEPVEIQKAACIWRPTAASREEVYVGGLRHIRACLERLG